MFSMFQELASQGFAALLIRVAIGVTYFVAASIDWRRRHEVGRTAIVSASYHMLMGGLLILGIYTQVVALIAAIAVTNGIVMARRAPNLVALPRSTLALLACMLLSLVITGAGALALGQ
jgi:hypothetical protein